MKHTSLRFLIVGVAIVMITAVALAQQPMQEPMADCKAMMEKQQKMMADVSAMDQKLDALVAEMNRASGSKRVDRMAAVLNELVGQRKAMRDGMMQMHSEMMSHMMQHMQSGMMKGMQEMSGCPMMKKSSEGAAHQH